MKNRFMILAGISFSATAFAQVGVNTENPKATLDVVASPSKPNLIDGIIAPRLEGNELKSKDGLYTEDQTGTIVYALSASADAGTENAKTINVDAKGYYYFDGQIWQKMGGGGTYQEPWKIQEGTELATDNTDNIYQQGKVAIGFDENDLISDKQFEVKGDMKAEFLDDDGYVYGVSTGGDLKENVMYIANNEDLSASTHTTQLGINKNTAMFISQDKTGDIAKSNTIAISNVGEGGIVGLASETSDGKYSAMGLDTWTDTVEGKIQTRQVINGNNVGMEVNVRPERGISFVHQGIGYGSYTFPKNAPEAGQVLSTGDAANGFGAELKWRSISDIAQSQVILRSPGGNCFKITVDDNGDLSTTATTCL